MRVVAGTALVLISAVIPWAVFTRYVLNSAASWPERTAVLLTIVLTFFGTAACYRAQLAHERVVFRDHVAAALRGAGPTFWSNCWSARWRPFMVVYGAKLVDATWLNSIAEFPGTVASA